MYKQFIEASKVLWVVGAVERLATLGMFSAPPLQLATNAVEYYLEADEDRHNLFKDDTEIAEIFTAIVKAENDEVPNNYDLNNMIALITEYKNNREKIIKYCLDHSN